VAPSAPTPRAPFLYGPGRTASSATSPGNIGALSLGRQHEGAIRLAKPDGDRRKRDQAAGFEIHTRHRLLAKRYPQPQPPATRLQESREDLL